MPQKIAILGAGPVGCSLGHGLTKAGHEVTIGVRSPDDPKYDDIRATLDLATVDAATLRAAVVILAVPVDALATLIPQLTLTPGQTVIDATNAVFTPVPDGFATVGDFVGSLLASGVALVKAFNTVGAEHLGGAPSETATFLPIAGDSAATDIAGALGRDLGFDVAHLGARDAFPIVEDHARLWIHLAIRRGWGRDFVFSVVRR